MVARFWEFNTWRWAIILLALLLPLLGAENEAQVEAFFKMLDEKLIPRAAYWLTILAALQGICTPSGSLKHQPHPPKPADPP
jgi:hypothetical protein